MQQFDPTVITHNLQPIAAGLATTLGTWIVGVVLGLLIGFLIAVLQLFCGRWVRGVLRVYIELFRGTPFLVQLFLLYYGGPSIGLRLEPLTALRSSSENKRPATFKVAGLLMHPI